MRKNRPSRRSGRHSLTRLFGGAAKPLKRAPRRGSVERLEERQMLAADTLPFNDPLLPDQWHLHADGQQVSQPNSPVFEETLAIAGEDINVLPAWAAGLSGTGVQIAILSGGFDTTHEDLGNLVTALGLDVVDDDTDPSFTDPTDFDGTALAGLIGATANNGIGGVGVAFGSDLIPVRIEPGALDVADLTTADIVQAVTYLAGFANDLDNDGVIDPITQSQTVEIYLHDWLLDDDLVIDRTAREIAPEVANAIETTNVLGRPIWDDIDGDGVLDANEASTLEFLGSIHIVGSGNQNGPGTDIAFQPIGLYQSAAYDELVNNRYTIGVGAIDHGGDYENPEAGNVTSWPEISPAVLIVAPAGSSGENGLEVSAGVDSGSALWTTDITGEGGRNQDPVFGFQADGDFLADTNYTSKYSETGGAAAQVAGAVALMLEANPELTYREVQYILMASARQNDQFSETWVTNPFTFFDDINYEPPLWASYDFDTDGEAGADVENGIIPNLNPLNTLERGFFFNNPDFELPIGIFDFNEDRIATFDELLPANFLVDTTGVILNDQSGMPPEPPVFLTIVGAQPEDPAPIFLFAPGYVEALNNLDVGRPGVYSLITPSSTPPQELNFENGAGFTVSWGMGTYLEETGYAHGALDVGLAVEMAELFRDLNLSLPEEVTVSTGIQGGSASELAIQARAEVDIPGTDADLLIPGVNNTVPIDTTFYAEFFRDFSAETIQDGAGNDLGEIITDAPFFNPETGGPNDVNIGDAIRGANSISIPIDPSVAEDFLSVEWVEFRTTINSGDVDNLRLTLVSPDGTHTELTPFRLPAGTGPFTVQQDQSAQGSPIPGAAEIIDAGIGSPLYSPSLENHIDGSEEQIIIGLDNEGGDPLTGDQPWTFTTNRHWGELLSIEGNSEDGAGVGGQRWEIMIENWGTGTAAIGQYEVVFHGVEATGTRLQGKIGVDDNAQQIDGVDQDQLFNFNRFLEFGEISIDLDGDLMTPDTFTAAVVLDTVGDSVFHNSVHETRDPDTGNEFRYAVVNKADYLDATSNDPTISGPAQQNLQNALIQSLSDQPLLGDDYQITGGSTLRVGLREGFGNNIALPFSSRLGEMQGDAITYQNFDYSQESFEAGAVVQATQYVVTYPQQTVSGVLPTPSPRVASGVTQTFVTGADGNYFFDVEATPAPPSPFDFLTPAEFDAAYANWLEDFGGMTFEYQITLENVDAERRIDGDYSAAQFQSPTAYNSTILGYEVQAFASQAVLDGGTSVARDLNFLLTVNPALTNVDVAGTVYRDRNGDGVQQVGLEESAVGVTVFHDANGNGSLDAATEVSAVTDANGDYSFTISGLTSPQTVDIVVVESTLPNTPVQLDFLSPADGVLSLSVSPGLPSLNADFTLNRIGGEPAQVTGVVYEDVNQNGVQDAGEGGVSESKQVRVYIDQNGNDSFDATEPFAFTNAEGTYVIESNTAGEFEVRVDPTSFVSQQIVQTDPAGGGGVEVTLVVGQTVAGVAFGIFDGRNQDFGDLYVDGTGNFPTLLSDNGARHVVIPGMFLGSGVDIDNDGFQSGFRDPNIDGTGDDTNGFDDEDGVELVTTNIQANSTIEFDIDASGAAAVLNAWFDFNNDGDWDDPGEQIFVNTQDLATGSTERIVAPTPADVDTSAGATYAARFRWGPFGLDYDGSANAGEVEDYIFASTAPIAVTGAARIDSDGDSAFDTSDTALVGATVFFDRDLDGTLDADEPRGIVGADGSYEIRINTTTEIDVTLRVDESTIDAGLDSLIPIDGVFSQTVSPGSPVVANFLYGFDQGVTGTVFNDDDGNGVAGPTEGGFAGITVALRNTLGDVIATTTTDANGSYTIPVAVVGNYSVTTDLTGDEFFVQTTPNRSFAVTVGNVTTAEDLGVENVALDFTEDYGDLIVNGSDNYPTTLANDGARHTVVPGVFLGDVAPDADPGDRESANATADDNLLDDDEEGVSVVTAEITASSTLEIDVKATGVGGLLNAWVDFNNDGDWDDAGEQIAVDRALTSGVTTRLVVNTPADVDATADAYAARFRWSTQAGLGVTGAAIDGEVEDYRLPRVSGVTPTELPSDFNGDGVVDLLDLDILGSNFGAGPGATKSQGDANGDGFVDLLDLDALGMDFGSSVSSSTSSATAPGDDSGSDSDSPNVALATAVPMPVLHPIEETEPDSPAFFTAALGSGSTPIDVSSASGTVVTPSDSGEDAIDAALLEWSLDAPADDADERSAYRPASREAAEDDEIEEDEALALAFAL